MVTKSGSNAIHGSVFEYVRNHAMNARNFFAATDDGLKRNQYGVAVGGPIVKNKTFFFFSWQGTQLRQRPPTSTTVPTAEQRRGDFSSLLPGTQLIDPTTKQPVPGNIIPPSQLDPVAQKVLETIPLPNQPNGLLYYTVASSQTDNQYIGRIDHEFTSNHRLSGRYFYDGLDNPAIVDPQNRLTNAADRIWKSHSLNFTDTITVTPSLLTNTTLSYSRTYNLQTGQDFAGNQALGIDVPIMSKGDTFRFGITNYFSNAVNALYRVARNQYNIQHSWTWSAAVISWTSGSTSRATRASSIRTSTPTGRGHGADVFPTTTCRISCMARPAPSRRFRPCITIWFAISMARSSRTTSKSTDA